jgi:hypothetical protein
MGHRMRARVRVRVRAHKRVCVCVCVCVCVFVCGLHAAGAYVGNLLVVNDAVLSVACV